jgi:hypothetical protein
MADILKRFGLVILGEGNLAGQVARTERARALVKARLHAEATRAKEARRKARLKRKRERRKAAKKVAKLLDNHEEAQ